MAYAGPALRGVETPSATSTNGTARLAAGLVIGLAVGAGVALLLAPRAGAETRQAIARRGDRLRRRGRDAWDDLAYEFQRATRRRRRAALSEAP